MQNTIFTFFAPIVAVLTGLIAWFIYRSLKKAPCGTERMSSLSDQIHSGAMTYLRTQYRILLLFVVVVGIILGFGVSPGTAIAFTFGAGFSMLAGYIGMDAATLGNVRTTNAARSSLSEALTIAFRSGSIMGLTVAGLGLLGISLFYLAFSGVSSIGSFLNSLLEGQILSNLNGREKIKNLFFRRPVRPAATGIGRGGQAI